jgi:hypothetical protein
MFNSCDHYTLISRIRQQARPGNKTSFISKRCKLLKTSARICAALLTLLLASQVDAARSGLRIDSGAWSDDLVIGSSDCPGSTPSGGVSWNGIRFHGGPDDIFIVDEYCQTVATFEEGLDEFEYLNSAIFNSDEAELARKIGANITPDFITGIRYTFVDGDRFDFHAEYFCFDGSTFIGLWDDTTPLPAGPVNPEDGCIPLPPEAMFGDGFELP